MSIDVEDDPRTEPPTALELKCSGLDAEQLARRSVEPSSMSLLGLLRHLAEVERSWFRRIMSGEDAPKIYCTVAEPDGDFDGAAPDPALVAEAWENWRAADRAPRHPGQRPRHAAAVREARARVVVFPELSHAADTAALGVDAHVAGVLETREDAAVPDERARRVAAEHGLRVVTASFAGSAGGGSDEAAGRSGIWSPDGVVVAEAGPEVGAIVRGTLQA
ncbi:MAG TPA: DUF664 domain-containing protein [Pseudonocardia sp.]|jgi:hypothetical protein|nr:DUF664 domain-containing protein [Pseudonocardia sp.]